MSTFRAGDCPAIFAAAVVVFLTTPPAVAQTYDFEKIADENTFSPSGGGKFTAFNPEVADPATPNRPVIDGDTIVFGGHSSTVGGFYKSVNGGAPSVVADTNTLIPGTASTYFFLPTDGVSIDGSNVAWEAINRISTRIAGAINVVADSSTPVPLGSSNFSAIGPPSISGEDVAFIGSGTASTDFGVYLQNSTGLNRIADKTTLVPPSLATSFDFMGGVSVSGTTVAFGGTDTGGQEGIYRRTGVGGLLQRIVDETTPLPLPAIIGNFGDMSTPSLEGTNVAFESKDSIFGGSAIFSNVGGLHFVADTFTPIPSGSGNFTGFGDILSNVDVTLDNGNVLFGGNGNSGQFGIYLDTAGSLSKVIDNGDTLDGQVISKLRVSKEALSNQNVVFFADFTNGNSGIYVGFLEHEWQGAGSGSWNTASNWSFSALPRDVVPTLILPDIGMVVTGTHHGRDPVVAHCGRPVGRHHGIGGAANRRHHHHRHPDHHSLGQTVGQRNRHRWHAARQLGRNRLGRRQPQPGRR